MPGSERVKEGYGVRQLTEVGCVWAVYGCRVMREAGVVEEGWWKDECSDCIICA